MADTEQAPTTESTEAAKTPLSDMAAQMFGPNYRAPERTEAPQEPVEQPEEETEEQHAPEEVEETEEQDSGSEEEQDESTEADEDSEGGEEPISSLDELLNHYEFDPEWFNGLEVAAKVDGQPQQVKIGDLVKSYQMTEAAEKRLSEAKEKARTQTQQLAERQEQIHSEYQKAAGLIQRTEKMLEKDASNINWAQLREQDPAEYSAKKAEIAERRQEIEQMKRDAVQEYQSFTQKSQEEMQQQRNEYLQREREALVEKLPEWKNEDKAKAEKSRLANYLVEQGFDKDEVGGLADHRLVYLARKAMLFDEGQSKADSAKKKVRKIPKVMKPGAPKSPEKVASQREKELRNRLKKTGSIDDAFALLQAGKSSSRG